MVEACFVAKVKKTVSVKIIKNMNQKRTFLLAIMLFCFSFYKGQHQCSHKHFQLPLSTKAANERSDTVDVLNYNVYLDVTDFIGQTLKGNCEIDFVALQNNINTISLDLLQMSVDSIVSDNQLLTYTYNDTLLIASLPATLNVDDTSSLIVYYQGSPQGDPSGWGGWYWQSAYSYNLGVGFEANPHNYGRVWHPCVDNFVERATYDYSILTSGGKTSYANGLMVSEQVVGTDSLLRQWRMDESIPTYLACLAVSNYTHVESNYISTLTTDTVPMYLISVPADTSNFKSSFVNLGNTVKGFEEDYGPYNWSKVGFHLVPFNSGAMEHATSIAYPRSAANGGLGSETLMAHELSHHWWGNLVTCRTAEDMWINEGFAAYSERLFLEHQYGYESYIDDIKTNHLDVLHRTHLNDGGYYAISGVPHNITYGDHSYNKGADVAHTMRSYFGDSLFFIGLKSFLADNMFKDVSSTDFMNHLNVINGIDATDFFNNWVFSPGFPHFSIDSMTVAPNGGNYDVELFVKQKLKAAPNFYSNVPLEVTFKANDWTEQTESFVMSGQNDSFLFTIPFNPELAFLNPNDKISQAVTGEGVVLTSAGTKIYSYPLYRMSVSSITDSVYVRMEHHWAAPDDFTDVENDWMYHISPDRYWRVDGIVSGSISATQSFMLDGKNTLSGSLDTGLVALPGFHEDSLVMFYRESAGHNWEAIQGTTISNLGSSTDDFARINVDNFKFGEYAFGWKKSTVGIKEKITKNEFNIYPNPSANLVNIDLSAYEAENFTISVFDMNGKLQITQNTVASQAFMDVSNLSNGNYLISVVASGKFIGSKVLNKN